MVLNRPQGSDNLSLMKLSPRIDLKKNVIDKCLYMRVNGSNFKLMVFYVDDILLVSNDIDLLIKIY